jgi:hypothetical protein
MALRPSRSPALLRRLLRAKLGRPKRPDRPLEQSAGSRLPVVGGYKERLSRHHSCFTTEALL